MDNRNLWCCCGILFVLILVPLRVRAQIVSVGGELQGDEIVVLGDDFGNFSVGSSETVCEYEGPIYGESCGTATAHLVVSIQPSSLNFSAEGESVSLISENAGASVRGHVTFDLPTAGDWELTYPGGMSSIYGSGDFRLSDSSGATVVERELSYPDDFPYDKIEVLPLSLDPDRYDLAFRFSANTAFLTGGNADTFVAMTFVPVPNSLLTGGCLAGLLGLLNGRRRVGWDALTGLVPEHA